MKFCIPLAAIAVIAGLPTPTAAADLPSRNPPSASIFTAPPPVLTWTGFYVGLNGGGLFGRDTPPDIYGLRSLNKNGGTFGGTVGGIYQFGNLVLGTEADIDWGSGRGDEPLVFGNNRTLSVLRNSGYTVGSRLNYYSTARVRLGYVMFGNFMPYITGGAYIQNNRASINGPGFTSNSTNTGVGWTGGGGIEWQFMPRWSLKAEYLYARINDQNYNFSLPGIFSSTPGIGLGAKVNGTQNIVRAGLNYRF